MFIHFLLLLYKILRGNSELEWYTDSGVWKMWGELGLVSRLSYPRSSPMKPSRGEGGGGTEVYAKEG